MKARCSGVATALPYSVELKLVRWVGDLRDEGVPVTPMMLRLQALAEANEAGIHAFTASWSWQSLFKGHHRLALRAKTRQGQICPPELDQIAKTFAKEVHEKAQSLGVTKIYNADQTAVNFEYLPRRTLAKKGIKTVWVKCGGKTKERATVMFLGDSEENKYDPYVIFKVRPAKSPEAQSDNDKCRNGFGAYIWKSISKAQVETGMQIYGNGKGWWGGKLTVAWLRYHFGLRPNRDQPVLLLLDDFSGHWTTEVIEYAKAVNVTLMKVPPNATSVCQPADATWNGPVKQRLRNAWILNLKKQLATRVASVPFKLKPPDRALLCEWVREAWGDLTASTIRAGFRHCGLVQHDEDVFDAPRLIEALQADEEIF